MSALFLVYNHAHGQNNVLELLPGSEVMEYDAETGIHSLRGNVNFKYQGNIMFCDSALYFERRKVVRAYGNVHINKKDTLNLYCDSLYYNGRTRKAKLWGNVRVRDQEYKLTTDTLEYDARQGQGYYQHGGKVSSIKSSETLTSRIGYFHPDSKNFFFSKEVHYKSPEITMTTDTLRYLYSKTTTYFHGPTDIQTKDATMYCETGWYNTTSEEGSLQKNAWISREKDYIAGDTLLYLPKQGEYIGRGNVYYMDSVQKTSFTGNYAFSSDSLHYALLTGDAIATKFLDDDTLHIHADTLYNYTLDTLELLKAYHGGKMYSRQFQCIADSITYDKQREKIELFSNPIVWSNKAELKGDFMDIDINDSVIKRVNIYNNSTILMEVEPLLYYNQIAGKDINADFRDNNLRRAWVYGNAMTVSFPEDEETTDSTFTKKRMGMNRLYSSDLRIDLDSNEITGITYLSQPDGAFYPMDQIVKSEQFVPGFSWKGDLRPQSREDLLKEATIITEETEEVQDEETEQTQEVKNKKMRLR